MKRAFVVVLGLFGLLSIAVAQKPAVILSNEPGWHKIGEITASFKLQNESIVVWGADEFKAIKLRVTDAPINIERLEVYYENGDKEQISVASELRAGAETRTINLKHPNAELNKVVFTYKTLPNYKGDKAEIELYGLKTASSSYRDEKSDVEKEMKDGKNEVREEARETNQELKEESREAEQDLERKGNEVKEKADEAGHEISEAAGNLGAEIKDKPYVDKVGPGGQRIYMDKHSKYYYINDKGNKVYLSKSEMKDNPKRD